MFAPPVAKAKTKTASDSSGRDAIQRSIFARRPFDGNTGVRETSRASWNFGDIPIYPYVKSATEIRGSTQRETNEAEAERAAHSLQRSLPTQAFDCALQRLASPDGDTASVQDARGALSERD